MLRFDELAALENRKTRIGMKAESLVRLREGGFHVPDGFVITADELDRFSDAELARYADENVLYAVRSSGTSEDLADSSFAGQYDSFLNVRGIANLRAAIEKCARSVHNDRVRAYAKRSGIDIGECKMAVIVQRMAQAQKAGVAFSIDSVNGLDKEIIIEAVNGLGEQLVSGRANPDYYSYNWFEKKLTAYAGGVLTETEVRKLAAVILDIQVYYGFPVDVEWAIVGEEIYILQSRPITAISYRSIEGEWTTADFRDGGVSAKVCKPLMASLYGLCFDDGVLKSFQKVRLASKKIESMYDVFFARPYWNWSVTKAGFAKLPGFVERKVDEDMGLAPSYEGDGMVTKKTLKTMCRALLSLLSVELHLHRMKRAAGKNRERMLCLLAKTDKLELRDKTAGELHEIWLDFIKNDYHYIECSYFRYIICTMLLSSGFKDKMKKHLPEADITKLMGGLSDVSHMRPIYEMWSLSRQGCGDEQLLAFLAKYKHHSKHELDISYENWDESPETIRAQIADFALLDESQNPEALARAQQKKYQETLERLPKRPRRQVKRFRCFLWWRDELKDISTKTYYYVRRVTLALGRALEKEGLLDSAEDIFFLTAAEIEQNKDLKETAAKNKQYYRSFRNFSNPNELGSRFARRLEAEPGARILKGVSCGGTTTTGTARVIKDIHDVGRLKQGDILVTTYTDPAWTAVFSKLSGVITETGGILSHAAVVSREYGLPCILVVKNATSVIQDGGELTMNCETGEIFITNQGIA
ncbi:MAG: PEP-utilizing enzyme [Oscillospiraceae bacterium]|nr:PEP-utilizing enzyme [Oscillospiraceae bacterium]